ncbi:MAG: HEAT repeat domain-containing protein [Kouleothrix sp.]|nr:HEAT repeat domain-containing protein [Kouleothrix sp.]
MDIKLHLQTIGMPGHRLAMAELKPLSGIGRSERETFWSVWTTIEPRRRAEIAHAMVDLAEDNVDLDFGEALLWMLDDEDAAVRSSAIDGLWEQDNTRVLRRLLTMLRSDPAPEVRTAVALTLSRFANLAGLEELSDGDAQALHDALLSSLLDQRQPLDVRRRSLESAGYFEDDDEIQRQIALAYASDEQLLRESALVAMGRSMLPRWLPTIAKELDSPSPALRYEAARAAGEMADHARSLLPKLAQLLNDRDSEVALAAIWALGQIGGSAAKRMLEQIRKTSDDARRQAAVEALEELSLEDGLFA